MKNGSVKPKQVIDAEKINDIKDQQIVDQWQNLNKNINYCLGLKIPKHKTLIMGIVNTTPDSFYDGGKLYQKQDKICKFVDKLIKEGVDIIDIGGESTRPGALNVPLDEEIERTIQVIHKIKDKIPVSIDTRKAEVMEKALNAGATIVNDVSAMRYDKNTPQIVKKNNANIVIMHASHNPQEMQNNTDYKHVVFDIYDFFVEILQKIKQYKINLSRIAIDPGIGFGKTTLQNIQIIKALPLFHSLGVPILIGASRKSFIGDITDSKKPQQRLVGSVVAALYAAVNAKVQCIRVHDVKQTKQAIHIYNQIHNASL